MQQQQAATLKRTETETTRGVKNRTDFKQPFNINRGWVSVCVCVFLYYSSRSRSSFFFSLFITHTPVFTPVYFWRVGGPSFLRLCVFFFYLARSLVRLLACLLARRLFVSFSRSRSNTYKVQFKIFCK